MKGNLDVRFNFFSSSSSSSRERKENLKIFLRVCTTNFNLKLLYLIIVGGSDKEIRYDESKLTILEKRRKEERRGKMEVCRLECLRY